MASGTIYGSTGDSGWTFCIDWSESSASDLNNTTVVTAKVYLGRASTQSYLGGNYSVSININGSSGTYSGNISYPTYINGGAWLYLKERSVTVTHDKNGSKSCSISASMSSSDFWPSSCSASGTVSLQQLDRNGPSVSFTASNIGTNSFDITITSSTDVAYGSGVKPFAYRLDSGSWVYGAAITSAGVRSQTISVTGLSLGTTYSVEAAAQRGYNNVWGYNTQSVTTLNKSYLDSVSDVTLGGTKGTFTFKPVDSTHKYKVVLTCGSFSYTIPTGSTYLAAGTVGQTQTAYLTTSCASGGTNVMTVARWAPYIPYKTGTITAELRTYDSDNNLLGSDSKTLTATVPLNSSTKPSIGTVVFSDGNNALYNTFGKGSSTTNDFYIKDLSTLKAVITLTKGSGTSNNLNYNASLKSVKLEVGSGTSVDDVGTNILSTVTSYTTVTTTSSTTATITSNTLSPVIASNVQSGGLWYRITITDSRDYESDPYVTSSIDQIKSIWNYWAPTGTVTYLIEDGSIKTSITWNVATLGSNNDCIVILTREKAGDIVAIVNKTLSDYNSSTTYKKGDICQYRTSSSSPYYIYEYIYTTSASNKVPTNTTYWQVLGRKDTSDNATITIDSYSDSYVWAQTEGVTDANMSTYQYTLTVKDAVNSNSYTASTGVVCISRHRGGRGVTFFADASDAEISAGGLWANSIRLDLTSEEYTALATMIADTYSSTTTYSMGDFCTYTVSGNLYTYEYISTTSGSNHPPTNGNYWERLN